MKIIYNDWKTTSNLKILEAKKINEMSDLQGTGIVCIVQDRVIFFVIFFSSESYLH